ncbi:MAG TPA: hypothetical protein VGT40_01505 [Methylomirabilota bacterium]|jgi:hypothetical protein|nr:hypothetical protein [Methylomirabilota bacterium]
MVMALVLGGCATLPPAAPIPDVATLAGTWSGIVELGRGPFELFYVTIDPDGSLMAWWGITTRWGRLQLGEGRPRFSLYIWSGDLEYFEGDGQRVLILKEDFGSFYARVTPYR